MNEDIDMVSGEQNNFSDALLRDAIWGNHAVADAVEVIGVGLEHGLPTDRPI